MEAVFSTTRKGEKVPLTPYEEQKIYEQVLLGKSSRTVAAWYEYEFDRRTISHTTVQKVTRKLRAENVELEAAVDRPDLAGKSDVEQLEGAIAQSRRLQLRALHVRAVSDYTGVRLALRALEIEIRALRHKIDHADRERAREDREEARLPKPPPVEMPLEVPPPVESTKIEVPAAVPEQNLPEKQAEPEVSSEVSTEVSNEVSSELPSREPEVLPQFEIPKDPRESEVDPEFLRSATRQVQQHFKAQYGDKDYMPEAVIRRGLVAFALNSRDARSPKKSARKTGAPG